jgi:hypothetical protein
MKTRRLVSFVVGTLVGIAGASAAPREPAADAVRASVARVLHHLDARRWPEVRAQLADRVRTDYTSLFGGAPQEQKADELVDLWKTVLTPLKATQHMLGPIDVTVQGNEATAECHVRAEHIAPGLPGGGEWMVAGHYVWKLTRKGSAWVVTSLTLETFFQTGNTKMLEEAAARK